MNKYAHLYSAGRKTATIGPGTGAVIGAGGGALLGAGGGAVSGALLGAPAGAFLGALNPDTDPETGRPRSRWSAALRNLGIGALAGGAIGAAGGAVRGGAMGGLLGGAFGAANTNPDFKNVLLNLPMSESQRALPTTIVRNASVHKVGSVINEVLDNPSIAARVGNAGAGALLGAGGGALGGALMGAIHPGTDPETGKSKSRWSAALHNLGIGALAGGTLGAAGGALAPAGINVQTIIDGSNPKVTAPPHRLWPPTNLPPGNLGSNGPGAGTAAAVGGTALAALLARRLLKNKELACAAAHSYPTHIPL